MAGCTSVPSRDSRLAQGNNIVAADALSYAMIMATIVNKLRGPGCSTSS